MVCKVCRKQKTTFFGNLNEPDSGTCYDCLEEERKAKVSHDRPDHMNEVVYGDNPDLQGARQEIVGLKLKIDRMKALMKTVALFLKMEIAELERLSVDDNQQAEVLAQRLDEMINE